jgi:hypothetical protein
MLFVSQVETERLLEEHLARLGGRVERPAELVASAWRGRARGPKVPESSPTSGYIAFRRPGTDLGVLTSYLRRLLPMD